MKNEIDLRWGHYCKANELDTLIKDYKKQTGIYIWIYSNRAGKQVTYVGKSIRPFERRMKEHLHLLFSGAYPTYKIDDNRKYHDFLGKEILGKKSDDESLLSRDDVWWYRKIESENYFSETFFSNKEKQKRIIEHYLDHTEFAFSTISSDASQIPEKEAIEAAERALAQKLHSYYLKTLFPDEGKKVSIKELFPSGNSRDTLVGRHGKPRPDIVLKHSFFSEDIKRQIPDEVYADSTTPPISHPRETFRKRLSHE